MSFVGDIIGDVVGGITGSKAAGKAAERAGDTQAAAAQAGVDEQRRQFDKLVELMSPYVTAGSESLAAQRALVGLAGPEAERAAVARQEASPIFQSLVRQGESAILQNASATGGLRGGNVQAALSQFRPQILNALIEQQYGRLGGITKLGQASAAGQAESGLASADSISNLLANQGAATAGGQIARSNVNRQAFGDLLSIGKVASGFKF